MKRQLFILMCTFMCLSGHAVVTDLETLDNTLYIEALAANPGSQINIAVKIKNTVTISNFVFDVYLPDGMSFVCDQSGNPVGSLNGECVPTDMFDLTSKALQGNGAKFQTSVNSNHINDNPSFYGSNGVVMTFAVAVSENMATGSYTITLKNMEVTNFETQQRASDLRKVELETPINVELGYVLLDENSTTAPEAAEAVNVRVLRTINANVWSTICLPFAMTEEQAKEAFGEDVQLADFTGYDVTEDGDENIVGIKVNFATVNAIEANHPYIIKVSAPVTEFSVEGVDVVPEDGPCVSFGYETGRRPVVYHPVDFIGTYVADFDFYHDAQKQALFLSGNKFYYATENSQPMKAFRAYFDFDDVLTEVEEASVKVLIDLYDEETGIDGIIGPQSNGRWYDLSGRNVTKPRHRGIYIQKGKKTLVK